MRMAGRHSSKAVLKKREGPKVVGEVVGAGITSSSIDSSSRQHALVCSLCTIGRISCWLPYD